ncbi:YbaB/EbfC family nucleoid-associated protein [Micromonospora polyrhachis]|uniref:DNA-binding protein YbaB n=1 Tax=Micromonospora polyrhachis TaxID=1282883 RepID=A0A7W7ST67_9ACTN|nr:YbaB/EbfC family nucleoid-associated protein [Micromonospora polyrhachis]MBB4960449.1 DNA-binding protein YbaB [Micromonospora polyrhachis]
MRVDDEMLAAMRARARDLTGQLQRITDSMDGLQERIGQVSVTAVSRDGLVRATVGSDGKPRDLHLDPRIYHDADAAALARTILDTIEVAAAEARERVKEICQPYVDGDSFDSYASGDLTQVMERMRQRLPLTEE